MKYFLGFLFLLISFASHSTRRNSSAIPPEQKKALLQFQNACKNLAQIPNLSALIKSEEGAMTLFYTGTIFKGKREKLDTIFKDMTENQLRLNQSNAMIAATMQETDCFLTKINVKKNLNKKHNPTSELLRLTYKKILGFSLKIWHCEIEGISLFWVEFGKRPPIIPFPIVPPPPFPEFLHPPQTFLPINCPKPPKATPQDSIFPPSRELTDEERAIILDLARSYDPPPQTTRDTPTKPPPPLPYCWQNESPKSLQPSENS